MIDLNNREIALLIWFAFIFGWVASKSQIRSAMVNVIKAAFVPKLRNIWVAMTIYLTLSIVILSKFGIWKIDNLKTTISWLLIFPLVSIMEANRITDEKMFFKKSMVELFGLTAFMECIVSLHSFSLLVELTLLPALTVLLLLLAYLENKQEHQSIHKILKFILIGAGALLLFATLYGVTSHFSDVATALTAREVLVPTMLTIMFLPFTWCLHAFMTYENVFARLGLKIKDQQLLRYAKLRSALVFRHDLKGLRQFSRRGILFEFGSKADIRSAIAKVKQAQSREKSPPNVQKSEGWQPTLAKLFLTTLGIETNDYQEGLDGWHAQSNYIEFDAEPIPNNVAYYVSGNEYAATKLKLSMNINSAVAAEKAEKRFVEIASFLLRQALNAETLGDFGRLLLDDNHILQLAETTVRMSKEKWVGGIPNGYSKHLTIIRGTSKSDDPS
jgi:hypothetical protein